MGVEVVIGVDNNGEDTLIPAGVKAVIGVDNEGEDTLAILGVDVVDTDMDKDASLSPSPTATRGLTVANMVTTDLSSTIR